MGKEAKTRVVVVGGGHAGAALLSALRTAVAKLKLGSADLSVVLVDPKPAFHTPVMMPGVLGAPKEWAAASVVPWESILDPATASHIRGVAVAVDTDAKTVTVRRVAAGDSSDSSGSKGSKKKGSKKGSKKRSKKGRGKEEAEEDGEDAHDAADDGASCVETVPYDLLVLGTGSANQGFSLPVDERVFPPSATTEDVIAYVETLGESVAGSGDGDGKAEGESDDEDEDEAAGASKAKNAAHILVVGGGPTGVEVASAIADFRRETKVTLVHSGPEILRERGVAEGEYPPPLSAKLIKKLTQKLAAFDNLDLITGDRVSVDSDGSRPTAGTIKLESGKKVKGVTSIVWATGSRLNSDLWMKDGSGDADEDQDEKAVSSDSDSDADADSDADSDSDAADAASNSDGSDKKKAAKTTKKKPATKGKTGKPAGKTGKTGKKKVSALRRAANVDGMGDLRVDDFLWVEGLVGSVFALGDVASHPRPVQKVGAQAGDQGRHVAASLASIAQARAQADDTDEARDAATTATKLKRFKPAGAGILLSLGGREGVGAIPLFGGMVVGRKLPLMLKGSASAYGKVLRARMLVV